MKVFCYGSNNQEQLTERCGVKIEPLEPAYLLDHKRVFRGWSECWQGGVASVIRAPGCIVYGGIAEISENCLKLLDAYEGINSGFYVRKKITIKDSDEKEVVCQIYVSTSDEFNSPSKDYLKAIAKTVGECWLEEDGVSIDWESFTIE